MRILYFGRPNGTSSHRMGALCRLGHEVTLLDPYNVLPLNWCTTKWRWMTGGLGMVEIIHRRTLESIQNRCFDLAWIDHGELISAALVRDLKARIPHVLCYNIDDPFGGRDTMLWREFLKAVPFYDSLVVVRPENISEAQQRGAKKVIRVFRAADEVAHAPRRLTSTEQQEWGSEVLFAGTAFPERGPFLAELVKRGVPLTLYGKRYQKLREWPLLGPCWRPADTGTDEGYAKAITGAKICLGLLSKGNRDQHTTRSMEIPALGGLLCGERTAEHTALYREDREAVFWSSAEECAAKCFDLLSNDERRREIALAGRRRYLKNPWQNMLVAQTILDEVLKQPSSRQSKDIDAGMLEHPASEVFSQGSHGGAGR